MVQLLLKHNADNEAKDQEEKPPLQFAHLVRIIFLEKTMRRYNIC